MNSSTKNKSFLPLKGALKQIQFWLESSHHPQVMLAMPTLEGFISQELPPHCTVTKSCIRGPRVLMRGKKRNDKNLYTTLARYPEDGLVEGMRSAFVVVLNGEPKLRFAEYSVLCQPGDFLLAPAQVSRFDANPAVYEKVTKHSYFDLLMIFYGQPDPHKISARLCHFREGQDGPAHSGEALWMRHSLLGHILLGLEEYLEREDADAKYTAHLLTGFIMILQKAIADGEVLSNLLPADSLHLMNHDPIKKALVYIRNHLDTPLSIDLVARWVGLNRSVFTRQFRAATDQSFTEYLAGQRVEQAKVLLIKTDFPIVQISKQCGLLPGRLRQLFQRYCKCSPSEYRRKNHISQNASAVYPITPKQAQNAKD